MSLSVANEPSSYVNPWISFRSAKGTKEQLQFSFADITYDLDKWSQKCKKRSVEIIDLEEWLIQISDNQPEIKRNSLDFNIEIVFIYQNKMRRYLLCEMIRRCMLRYIEDLYQLGTQHFNGQLSNLPLNDKYGRGKILPKIALVNQCHRHLLTLVPPRVPLLLKPKQYEEKLEHMKYSYRLIKAKGIDMKSKLS